MPRKSESKIQTALLEELVVLMRRLAEVEEAREIRCSRYHAEKDRYGHHYTMASPFKPNLGVNNANQSGK